MVSIIGIKFPYTVVAVYPLITKNGVSILLSVYTPFTLSI